MNAARNAMGGAGREARDAGEGPGTCDGTRPCDTHHPKAPARGHAERRTGRGSIQEEALNLLDDCRFWLS